MQLSHPDNQFAAFLSGLEAGGRAHRYGVRLKAHLAKLPDDAARRAFLARESERWLRLEQEFVEAAGKGTYTGDATAWDYTETQSVISKLSALYAERVPA